MQKCSLIPNIFCVFVFFFGSMTGDCVWDGNRVWLFVVNASPESIDCRLIEFDIINEGEDEHSINRDCQRLR
jgi:hypothetical protein